MVGLRGVEVVALVVGETMEEPVAERAEVIVAEDKAVVEIRATAMVAEAETEGSQAETEVSLVGMVQTVAREAETAWVAERVARSIRHAMCKLPERG